MKEKEKSIKTDGSILADEVQIEDPQDYWSGNVKEEPQHRSFQRPSKHLTTEDRSSSPLPAW